MKQPMPIQYLTMRWLYTLVAYVLLPGVLLRLWWRSRLDSQYAPRWHERFGRRLQLHFQKNAPVFWLHAVSVGEVGAAQPLITALQNKHPHIQWLITTTTLTGAAHAKALYGDGVQHRFAPYDLPHVIHRWMQCAQPDALIIMETELWPNWIHACHHRNIPILLANARLSERSQHRYQKIAWLTQPMIQCIDQIAAQYDEDAKRFMALGANTTQIMVTGNLKSNRSLPADTHTQSVALKQRCGTSRPTWVAASTQAGEEKHVLAAHQIILRTLPNALLILAPRHPERFDSVAKQVAESGLKHVRYQSLMQNTNTLPHSTSALLLDCMGQLHIAYACADVAFVGGSLVNHGGQNILEPAALNKPILTGPHMRNFASIHRMMTQAQACITVEDAASLAKHVVTLLKNPQAQTTMSENAHQVLQSQTQALPMHVDWLESHVLRTTF